MKNVDYLTNIADHDQTAPKEQSDQGHQCLLLHVGHHI